MSQAKLGSLFSETAIRHTGHVPRGVVTSEARIAVLRDEHLDARAFGPAWSQAKLGSLFSETGEQARLARLVQRVTSEARIAVLRDR